MTDEQLTKILEQLYKTAKEKDDDKYFLFKFSPGSVTMREIPKDTGDIFFPKSTIPMVRQIEPTPALNTKEYSNFLNNILENENKRAPREDRALGRILYRKIKRNSNII